MHWTEWLRLLGEVIALVLTWFASRRKTKMTAIRRVRAALQDNQVNVHPDRIIMAAFFPRRANRDNRQRRLLL